MRLAVVNLKGGVGKTITSVFLAAGLADRGRTLLVDADPQRSALSWSELEPGLPFDVVGLPVKDLHKRLLSLGEGYEHIVIDTPPGVESAAIVRSAALAAELAIVPLPPSNMDVDRLRATLELLAEVEPVNPIEVRILLTRVRARTRLGSGVHTLLSEEFDMPLLATQIPLRESYAGAFGSMPSANGDYARVLEEIS